MGVPSKEEIERFVSTFLYSREAFLVDDVTARRPRRARDRSEDGHYAALTRRAAFSVGDLRVHPRHVSAPDLLLLTGNLGCLHAYFLHGCRWDEGWVGFGNRIHRADFRGS